MENIKINTLVTASAKKEAPQVSKKDFMEQLESFLEKNQKSASDNRETKDISNDETETDAVEDQEEDFEEESNINLMDLNLLANQPVEIKGEVVEIASDYLAKVSEVETENLVGENITLAPETEEVFEELKLLNEPQVEEFLAKLETQLSENPEMELQDAVEGLLSENKSKLEEDFKHFDIEDIENISQEGNLKTTELDNEKMERFDRSNQETVKVNESVELNVVAEEGIEDAVAVDEVLSAPESEQKLSELDQDDAVTVEEQSVDLLNNPKTFEPVNRTTFVQEVSTPVQQVAQEDFVSNVETLIIEQTEATNTVDNITTARMQLTPDHLGKVSVQIEMTGKELTAKLIVEQYETKEWIDQQVAHLREKLLAQEITVTEFQVVVDDNPTSNQFMSNEENPFFKQKEKDSQEKRKQRMAKAESIDTPARSAQVQYADAKGVSLFV